MEIQCKTCNRIFEVKSYYSWKERKYCSLQCYWESLKESLKGQNNPHYKGKITKTCPICGRTFEVYSNPDAKKQIFCSLNCYKKAVVLPDKICLVCKKLFHTRKHEGKFCSRECQRLYRLRHPIRYWLNKKRENLSKEKNPAWKGGVTKKSKLLRSTTAFQEWRRKVFEKDNYTCQICFQRGVFLEPHHIKNVANYPELAFDITNGLTLCIDCHKKIDKYRH
jgi:hypothetical protein